MSICSGIALPILYRPVQYPVHGHRRRPPRAAPADARDPGVRGARGLAVPGGGGPGLRAPLDRAGGVGGRRVLAARAGRRRHVDASRPRPLPRQGTRPARDVRRADGEGRRHEPRARGLDAHRRSVDRHLRCERDRGGRAPDRGRRRDRGAAARGRQRRGRLLRRRGGGPRHLPRSGQPRRGVAVAGHLLLREQRLRRVLAGLRAACGTPRAPRRRLRGRTRRGRRQRRRRDRDRDGRGRRRGARRTRSRRGRGGHVPLARPLRRGSGALPIARRAPGVGGTRSAARQRAQAAIGGSQRRRARSPAVVGRARARRRSRSRTAPAWSRRGDAERLRRPPATRTCRAARAGGRRPHVPDHGRDPRRARSGAHRRRARLPRRDRRRGRGQRVRADAWAARALRRSRPRHPDLRERDHRPRCRRRDGGHAPGRRAHVPRLRRRVPRPAAQPGREAPVHDRRDGADGVDRPDPVRSRPLVGEPALAEPRGAARAHPGAERRDAVDPGRHLRVAARRDPGPEPGRLHREPAALRHEGTAAAGRAHRADRAVGRGVPRERRHRRVGLPHGARGGRRRARNSRSKASPSR